MTPGRVVRRAAAGLAVTGLAGLALLGVEAMRARQRKFLPAESAPTAATNEYGRAFAPPLRLAVLGDSTAAGVGVDAYDETVAGRLASMLAASGRFVTLDALGVSGSRAHDLAPQVSRALLHPPDVAVILIGANDATHLSGLDDLESDLRDAVRRLREAGASVVVGTCPDMGAITAFDQPLRAVAAWSGRRVAEASRTAVADAGGVAVDLAAETGPAFRRDPERFLSSDEFHPSAEGYRLWAEALQPAVLTAAATVPANQ